MFTQHNASAYIQDAAERARHTSEAEARAAIVAHQKAQLAEAEKLYLAAVTAGNYPAAEDQAKRCNRIRTALVLSGAMVGVYEADRIAREQEDRDTRPWTTGTPS